MKIRYGYVSNSSSSSFIIAVKDPTNLNIKITLDVNLSAFKDNIIKTKQELLDYFKERYLLEPENDKDFLHYLELIDKGEMIIYLSANSDGDPIEQFICEHGIEKHNNDNITILQGEGGY